MRTLRHGKAEYLGPGHTVHGRAWPSSFRTYTLCHYLVLPVRKMIAFHMSKMGG